MISRSAIQRNVDIARQAAGRSVESVRRLLGIPADPDLRLYRTLKSDDFRALTSEFGEQPVTDYIRAMEVRQMRGD